MACKKFLLRTDLFKSAEVMDLFSQTTGFSLSVIVFVLCEIYKNEDQKALFNNDKMHEIAEILDIAPYSVKMAIDAGYHAGLIKYSNVTDDGWWTLTTTHAIDKEAEEDGAK